jgi:hypothetical protein
MLFSAATLFAADEDAKTKPRHPAYQLLGHDPPPPDSPLNPNFLLSRESKILAGTLWNGSFFPERLVGLDVADADGDRLNEIVYVTPRNVYLARRAGEVLQPLAEYKAPLTLEILSVDFYDTNGDGRSEIIISAQNSADNASSFILGYSGKSLTVLAEFIPWYLRVVGPEKGKILVAQKGGSSNQSAYSGKVYYAEFVDNKLSANQILDLPFGVNLFNFNFGPLGPTKQDMIVAISPLGGHLRLYSGANKNDLVSEKNALFCGTVNKIRVKSNSSQAIMSVEYLPSRILFADIDKNGANDVIVARNSQSGLRSVPNLRSFDGGIIEAYNFANISLNPFFSSADMLSGPAVDYQLADFDNNGTRDLVVGVVISSGSGMLSDSKSIIVSYSNLYTPETPPETPK